MSVHPEFFSGLITQMYFWITPQFYDLDHIGKFMINPEILRRYGAKEKTLTKGEFLFREGESARYYFQILEGEVFMNNYTEDGREHLQGIFSAGRSFGEPPLIGEFPYPANAVAAGPTTIFRLDRENLWQLLRENPEEHFNLTRTLARRLEYKSMISAEMSANPPDHRILRLLDYLKYTIYKIEKEKEYEVELTRQQIADLTGLRVETVIKTVKRLEEKGRLEIRSRKIIY